MIIVLHVKTKNIHRNKDINRKLVDDDGQLALGMTKCAHFDTFWGHKALPTEFQQPRLTVKTSVSRPCWYHFKKYNIDQDQFLKLIPSAT